MTSRRAAVVDRDHQVVRTTGGVYVRPGHWAAKTVHSFYRWTGATTLQTWCGIDVDLEDKARLTPDLITCVSCAEASWQALRKGRHVL
jgi:hypothetical protein